MSIHKILHDGPGVAVVEGNFSFTWKSLHSSSKALQLSKTEFEDSLCCCLVVPEFIIRKESAQHGKESNGQTSKKILTNMTNVYISHNAPA